MIDKIKLLGFVIVAAEIVVIMGIHAVQNIVLKVNAFWLAFRQLTW